jgi:hypothetical protein
MWEPAQAEGVAKTVDLLTATLGGILVAVELARIEAISDEHETPAPSASRLDLAARWELPQDASDAPRALRVTTSCGSRSLLVGHDLEVTELPARAVEPLPRFVAGAAAAGLKGVVMRDPVIGFLLDLDRLAATPPGGRRA